MLSFLKQLNRLWRRLISYDSEEIDCRVLVDRDTGEYETFRVWTVVEDEEYLEEAAPLTLEQAGEKDQSLAVGDTYEKDR